MKRLLTLVCLVPAMAMAVIPPYHETFDTSSSVSNYKFLDANGDGKTWKYSGLLDQQTGETDYCIGIDGQKDGTDDWAITPSVYLTAGTYYEFSADVRAWSSKWEETFEMWVGTSATLAGMTTQLLEATSTKVNEYRRYTVGFMPEKSGAYYFAIRHHNEGDSFAFYVDNISVERSTTETAPEMPKMTLVPDWNGELKADVNFTTPTKSLGGADITSLTKAEVFRDGELIATIEDIETGKDYTYTDTGMEKGYHEYAVTVSSAKGTSPKATGRRWCGVPKPARPASCKVVETEENGVVTVSWTPVTTDVDGYEMNPDLINYVVLTPVNSTEFIYWGWKVKGESLTFNALRDGMRQDIFYGGVYAITDEGYSPSAPATDYLFIGDPYPLPFRESYADGVPSYLFGGGRTAGNGGQLTIYRDAQVADVSAQDGDNGFMMSQIDYKESAVKLILGKFVLPEGQSRLSFWYFSKDLEGENANTVDVWVNDSEGVRHEVATFEQTGAERNKWYEAVTALDDFAGETVTIELNITCVSRVFTIMDNFAVESLEDAITSLSAPTSAPLKIYDLQGRPLSSPTRGITIVNGRKCVNKD